MKTKCFFILIMTFMVSYTYAQENLIKKLSDQKGITQVTITKALLGNFSKEINGIKLGELEEMTIFTSEEEKGSKIMRKEIDEYFKKDKSYEVLMKVKDTEEAIFYGKKDKEWLTSFVMITIDGDETILISLKGRFDLKDIQSIIESKKENNL